MKSKQKNNYKKRCSQRIPDALVQYHLLDKPNCVETVLLKNVGTGGVCFYSHNLIQIGDSIRIKLLLVGLKDPIITSGKVIWIRKSGHYTQYEIGIKFVILTQNDYEILTKLIELRFDSMCNFEHQILNKNINLDYFSGSSELF